MAYSPRRGRQTRGLNAGTHRLENNASPVRLRERARSESSVFQAPAKLHSVPPASVSAGFEGPNGRSARETGEPEENPAYSTIRNPNSLYIYRETLLCFALLGYMAYSPRRGRPRIDIKKIAGMRTQEAHTGAK